MEKVVVGMIGLGTVGTGVAKLLSQQNCFHLKKVAVRDMSLKRSINVPCPLTKSPSEIIDDPEIEVVIEATGGEQPAGEYLMRAIEKHKHVITANKEVLAKHGPEIFELARKKHVAVSFEAAVAGGVPVISTIARGLEGNKITSIVGILNGTTNFILSQMDEKGSPLSEALSYARSLGYAEADPSNDIDGHDIAYKLSVLSALAYGAFIKPMSINRQSVSTISLKDLKAAKQLGYRIKMLGCAVPNCNGLYVNVGPTLVPLASPLANVAGVNNGIIITGDPVGEIVMIGPGAGQMPTASAIVGDLVNIASGLEKSDSAAYLPKPLSSQWANLVSSEQWSCPYFLRLSVNDIREAIPRIRNVLSANDINVRVLKQFDDQPDVATICILTDSARLSVVDNAVSEIKKMPYVKLENYFPIHE